MNFEPEAPGQVYCAECAHLIGRRTVHEQADSWRCAAKQNVLAVSKDLVTGSTVYHYTQPSCRAAREAPNACGSAGLWYTKYEPFVPPARSSNPLRSSQSKPSADDLLAELGS